MNYSNNINQSGSSIFYNPFIDKNSLVKYNFNEKTNIMNYKDVIAPSNDFTQKQKKDIDIFVNFILPFVISPDTKKIIGPDIVENLQVIGAGSFGITLAYKNLLIKILKVDKKMFTAVSDELNISDALFRDTTGQRYTNIPDSINIIYGMITGSTQLWETIINRPNIDPEYAKLHLYTNLDKYQIDAKKFEKSIVGLDLDYDVKYPLQGHIAALFLDKATMSLSAWQSGFNEMSLQSKALCIDKFYDDMFTALYYIHFNREYVHNDIKPDNIVIYLGSNIQETYYQLIDFGLLQKLKSISDNEPRKSGTRLFMTNTLYEGITNICYDWHCVLICVLNLLGFVHVKDKKFEFVDGEGIYNIKTADDAKNKIRGYFGKIIKKENIVVDPILNQLLNKIVDIIAVNIGLYEFTYFTSNKIKTVDVIPYIKSLRDVIYNDKLIPEGIF